MKKSSSDNCQNMAFKRVKELDLSDRMKIIQDLDAGRVTFEDVAQRYDVSVTDVKIYYRDHRNSIPKAFLWLECTENIG